MTESDSGREEILNIFQETGALLTGHFVLRSGLHSGHFFQCARLGERLDKVAHLAELLLQQIDVEDFATILAPAMGGLVFGQEVARQAGKRYIFAEKVNDRLALRRGFQIAAGERILVAEDVITRGGRVREALKIIQNQGGIPIGVTAIVDRSQGQARFDVPLTSLLEMTFPTYPPDDLPQALQAIPIEKPGS